jgi:hypothetical protein
MRSTKGERRAGRERKYYLPNLAIATPIKALTRTVKAHWICGQAHLRLKEEFGRTTLAWSPPPRPSQ